MIKKFKKLVVFMKITKIVALLCTITVAFSLQGALKLINKSSMFIEFNKCEESNMTTGSTAFSNKTEFCTLQPNQTAFFNETPWPLSIREVKKDGSRGYWKDLGPQIFGLAMGKRLDPSYSADKMVGAAFGIQAKRANGIITINNSNRMTPSLWNIEATLAK
jgi:hypothetical protein